MNSQNPEVKWVEASKKVAKDFSYLWKLDDPQWVKQREIHWDLALKTAFKDTQKEEMRVLQPYFLTGSITDYLHHIDKLYCTPFETKEELNAIFYSRLMGGGSARIL